MITYRFCGGLCNSIYQIFGLFMFCGTKNISFDKIKINIDSERWFGVGVKKRKLEYPFIINKTFFKNIEKYFFPKKIINDELNKINHVNITYKLSDINNIDYTDNIVFHGCNFVSDYTVRNNIQLFKELFYNFEAIQDTLQNNEIFKNENITGIHCRRGDFKFVEYNKYIIKDDFIENILKTSENKVAIFSDEIDYYKNKFDKYNNVLFIENDKPYKDIYLMGYCHKLYTTSYSTFSRIAKVFNKIIQEKL